MQFFWLVILFLFINHPAFGRTWKEIKESGKVRFAIQEKKTVFEKVMDNGKESITGFHYLLANQFAKRHRLKPEFVVVSNIDQYLKLNNEGTPRLLDEVDIYADSLTATFDRKRFIHFSRLFDVIAVIISYKKHDLSSIEDLAKLKTSIAKNSSYEKKIFAIEQKINEKLDRITALNSADQANDLLENVTDYTLLDSDQAFFYVQQKKELSIDFAILGDLTTIEHIGWGSSKDDQQLNKEIEIFIKKAKSTRLFDKVWRAQYGITFEKYTKLIKSIEEKGTTYLSESLDHFLQGKFQEALDTLHIAIDNSLSSKQLRKLYDRIFLRLIKQPDSKVDENISNYLDFQPSTEVIDRLKKDFRANYESHIRGLRDSRNKEINVSDDLEEAIMVQEEIVYLEGHRFEEVNLLKSLKIQQSKRLSDDILVSIDTQERELEKITPPPPGNKLKKDLVILNISKRLKSTNIPVGLDQQKKIEEFRKKPEKEIEKMEGERYFILGLQLKKEKSYENAIKSFKSAISLNYKVKESSKRILDIRQLIKAKKKNEEREKQRKFNQHFKRALKSYFEKNHTQAMDNILAAKRVFPGNQQAIKYYNLISNELKLIGEKKIDPLSPYYQYAQVKMNNARELLAEKKYQKANENIEEVLGLFPHNEDAKKLLIEVSVFLNPVEVKKTLENYNKEGIRFFEEASFFRAKEQFLFVNRIQPKNTTSLKYLRQIDRLEQKQRKREVEEAKLKDEKIKLFEVEKIKASQLAEAGKLEEAAKSYRKLLQEFPEDYGFVVKLSELENRIRSKQEVKKVVVATQEQTNKKQLSAEGYYLKGQFFFRLKDYETTLTYWQQALMIDPNYQKVRENIIKVKKLMRFQ